MVSHLQTIYFDFSLLEEHEKYIKDIVSIKNTRELSFDKKLTYFIWENWSGKSTLIECIATTYWFNKEWWTLNSLYETNKTDNFSSNWLKLSWKPTRYRTWFFFRAEWIYNFSNYLEDLDNQLGCSWSFNPYWWKNLHKFSHWEQFMRIIKSRIDIVWFYIFDEIESALSPNNQLKLVEIIKYMRSNWSQFIIATHSPILLSINDSCIYNFDDKIEKISYDNASCVDIYKRLLIWKNL